jgi:hypothetical protein
MTMKHEQCMRELVAILTNSADLTVGAGSTQLLDHGSKHGRAPSREDPVVEQ